MSNVAVNYMLAFHSPHMDLSCSCKFHSHFDQFDSLYREFHKLASCIAPEILKQREILPVAGPYKCCYSICDCHWKVSLRIELKDTQDDPTGVRHRNCSTQLTIWNMPTQLPSWDRSLKIQTRALRTALDYVQNSQLLPSANATPTSNNETAKIFMVPFAFFVVLFSVSVSRSNQFLHMFPLEDKDKKRHSRKRTQGSHRLCSRTYPDMHAPPAKHGAAWNT